MKNIRRAIWRSRRASEWHLSNRRKNVYEIEEVDEITEEVSKVFDEMKEAYGLSTEEVEKPGRDSDKKDYS